MKTRLTTFIVLLMLVLTGCFRDRIDLDKEHPFVVKSIDKYNDYNSLYTAKTCNQVKGTHFNSCYKEIVLPTGMYNIGDTITLCPK